MYKKKKTYTVEINIKSRDCFTRVTSKSIARPIASRSSAILVDSPVPGSHIGDACGRRLKGEILNEIKRPLRYYNIKIIIIINIANIIRNEREMSATQYENNFCTSENTVMIFLRGIRFSTVTKEGKRHANRRIRTHGIRKHRIV